MLLSGKDTATKILDRAVELAKEYRNRSIKAIKDLTDRTEEAERFGRFSKLESAVLKGFLSFGKRHFTVMTDNLTRALSLAEKPSLPDRYAIALIKGASTACNLDPEFSGYIQRAVEDRAEEFILYTSPETAETLGSFYCVLTVGRARWREENVSAVLSDKAEKFVVELPADDFARGFLRTAREKKIPIRSEKFLTGMALRKDRELVQLALNEMADNGIFPENKEFFNLLKKNASEVGADFSPVEELTLRRKPEVLSSPSLSF